MPKRDEQPAIDHPGDGQQGPQRGRSLAGQESEFGGDRQRVPPRAGKGANQRFGKPLAVQRGGVEMVDTLMMGRFKESQSTGGREGGSHDPGSAEPES